MLEMRQRERERDRHRDARMRSSAKKNKHKRWLCIKMMSPWFGCWCRVSSARTCSWRATIICCQQNRAVLRLCPSPVPLVNFAAQAALRVAQIIFLNTITENRIINGSSSSSSSGTTTSSSSQRLRYLFNANQRAQQANHPPNAHESYLYYNILYNDIMKQHTTRRRRAQLIRSLSVAAAASNSSQRVAYGRSGGPQQKRSIVTGEMMVGEMMMCRATNNNIAKTEFTFS